MCCQDECPARIVPSSRRCDVVGLESSREGLCLPSGPLRLCVPPSVMYIMYRLLLRCIDMRVSNLALGGSLAVRSSACTTSRAPSGVRMPIRKAAARSIRLASPTRVSGCGPSRQCRACRWGAPWCCVVVPTNRCIGLQRLRDADFAPASSGPAALSAPAHAYSCRHSNTCRCAYKDCQRRHCTARSRDV